MLAQIQVKQAVSSCDAINKESTIDPQFNNKIAETIFNTYAYSTKSNHQHRNSISTSCVISKLLNETTEEETSRW